MDYKNTITIGARVSGVNRQNIIYNKLRKQVNRMVHNMDNFMSEENSELGRFVRKSAKLRAPRSPPGSMTRGKLAKSIGLIRRGKRYIRVYADSDYAGFQEFGFTPHYVSPYKHPELYSWYIKKTGTRPPRNILVSKNKPFMQPAVDMGVKRIPNMIRKVSDKSATKAGFRKVR